MKTLWAFLAINMATCACFSQNNKAGNRELQTCNLKPGDSYAGGIIVYLFPGECHGLVCAPRDQAKDMQWVEANNLCKALNIAGFSDWRLPTRAELDEMFNNLHKQKLGNFGSNNYWSSTEGGNNDAWSQYFDTGYQTFDTKNYPNYVRAVRTF